MHEIIEPLIHKASVSGLCVQIRKTGLSIGDVAELGLADDGRIAVYARIVKRGFLLRRPVRALVGYLGHQASQILTPALRRGAPLRVRVVSLTPEHLAPGGKAEMSVSVWGARPMPFRVNADPA
ncbi:hypothetical protein [Pseudorhodobacter sp.]|uniref:hypothetical protein n=1 Tax=Pseudorhodobacter sp. TaxID=1934400 RepID=UPI00264A2932|nr:hypothetical protein [Pseudorhodobacter sp.]MDN5785959.1 hypothetical protein [Pseudorhodobacter sp.]